VRWRTGRLEEAAKFVERSLGEEQDYLPALVMKARLAQRQGKKAEAIRHLEAVLARKGAANGDDARRAVQDAVELMAKLDVARAEYEMILAGYVDKLLGIARGAEKRSPELANACYRQILAVRSDHPEALRKLKSPAKAAPKPRGTPLFNGKDLEGWTGKAPAWRVEDRVLHARLDGVAQINRYREELEGDFELVVELRLIDKMGNDPLVGVIFGGRGPYDHFGLWIFEDSLRLERQTEERKRSGLQRRSVRRMPGKFTRKRWHAYKIVRDSKRITVFVDRKEVFSFAGADRSLDGFIALWVQDSLVEIRSVRLSR